MRLGTVDKQFLKWLKITLEEYGATPRLQEFIPRIRIQLTWTDEQLAAAATHMSQDAGTGAMLQHYPVPLLDGRVSALWSFDTQFQRQLLEIRRNVAILDDAVERSRKYFDMTFSKLEGDNYDRVTGNLTQTYALYAERAIIVVDQIKSLRVSRL